MEVKDSLISAGIAEKMNRQFIGISPQIREVYHNAQIASEYPDTHVLITGESGTGKDIVARIIHFLSKRGGKTFGVVSSSTITESLLESVFSGRKNGSFTKVLSERNGFLAITDGGTLLLDEIGDMPLVIQSKLVSIIIDLDAARTHPAPSGSPDFRLISSTNRNPGQMIKGKKFLPELLQQLCTIHIHIPPLRERMEDIEPLLMFFTEYFALKFHKSIPHISNETLQVMKKYFFSGNVRELKNMTERAVILCKGNEIKTSDFHFAPESKSNLIQAGIKSAEINPEKELILRALKSYGYNQTTTAAALGMSRDTLIRKMKKYYISIIKENGGDDPEDS